MTTFVISDIHGHYDLLRDLLFKAEIIDYEENRYKSLVKVVSIGDLANVVTADINGDRDCLDKVGDWIDIALIGNHEAGLLFPTMGFGGMEIDPEVKQVYSRLERQGKLRMAYSVGETLLTHAGVHEYLDWPSAAAAEHDIQDVYHNWSKLNDDTAQRFSFCNGSVEIPKYMVLEAVPASRGGDSPLGGILWCDWSEPKTTSFSQVVGHSPRSTGPICIQHYKTGIFTLNIDTGAKQGLTPSGVWLDENGLVEDVV